MADSPATESSVAAGPHALRWRPFHLTAALRRRILRALVVVVVFVAFVGGLTAAFGISILQYTLYGFRTSAIVIVAAIGLTLIYGIRGFANFAYGDLMTLGAYVALFVNVNAQLSIIWGAITSFFVLVLVGIVLEILIFSRLEGRGPVAPIVASVGVGLIIQNGIYVVAEAQPRLFSVSLGQEVQIVPGLGISWLRDGVILGVGLGFMLVIHTLLTYTNLGKAMRATADNLELAKATGIDTKRVTYATWALSCGFASIAGVLLGIISDVQPLRGVTSLLLIFAAVIVGGIGSAYGAMLGGLVVGLSQEMVVPLLVWLGRPDVLGIPHADAYNVAVPFLILILVLLFRPSGIAGRQAAIVPRGVLAGAIAKARAARRTRLAAIDAGRKSG
jgi:branched-subunit amino acid ABC-type transport system permease component